MYRVLLIGWCNPFRYVFKFEGHLLNKFAGGSVNHEFQDAGTVVMADRIEHISNRTGHN